MVKETRILVVDDDANVRKLIREILEGVGLEVGTYSSAEDFLEALPVLDGGENILILDYRMGGMTGLELQADLLDRGIDFPIIFVSGQGDVAVSVQAMKAGAADFLEKPFNSRVLVDTVETAVTKHKAAQEIQRRRAKVQDRYERLTPREREAMRYLVEGKSNRQIAELMNVTTRTIEVHRARVMDKMAADSLPSLVRMAAACGLIDITTQVD